MTDSQKAASEIIQYLDRVSAIDDKLAEREEREQEWLEVIRQIIDRYLC